MAPAGVPVIDLRSDLLMENYLWEIEQLCHLPLGSMNCVAIPLKLFLFLLE